MANDEYDVGPHSLPAPLAVLISPGEVPLQRYPTLRVTPTKDSLAHAL